MKYAIFVEGLITREVPLMHQIDYYKHSCLESAAFTGDGMALCDATIERKSAPIHHLRKVIGGRFPDNNDEVKDIYIAYSEEVQDLLFMPFDTFKVELDAARHSRDSTEEKYKILVRKYKSMSIFDKIKFLWKG